MKVRALRSFGGAVTMRRGQETDIKDMFIVDDLLKAGYVEALEENNDGEVETGHLDPEQLKEMTVPELRKLANDMGLDDSGKKDELIERICSAEVQVGDAE